MNCLCYTNGMTRFSARQQGFTIIEIIVVIVVILILAAIAMVGYSEMQDRVHMSQKQQTAATIHAKMKRFFSAKGRYPNSTELNDMRASESYFLPLRQSGAIGGWPCDNKLNVCLAWSWDDYQLNVTPDTSWNGSGYTLFFWDSEVNLWRKEEVSVAPAQGTANLEISTCGVQPNAVDGTCTFVSRAPIN